MQVKESDLSTAISQSEQSFSLIDVYEPSQDNYRVFMAKLDDVCFCKLLAAIFVLLRGTQTWLLHGKPYEFELKISFCPSKRIHSKKKMALTLKFILSSAMHGSLAFTSYAHCYKFIPSSSKGFCYNPFGTMPVFYKIEILLHSETVQLCPCNMEWYEG